MNFKENKLWIVATGIFAFLFFVSFMFNIYSLSSNQDFISNNQVQRSFGNELNRLDEVYNLIKNDYYLEPGTEEDFTVGALKGIVSVLNDPYSIYYTPDEFESRISGLKGKFGGIGAWVGDRDGQIMIIKPIQGKPAARAGLLPMDVIIAVDGQSVIGLHLDGVVDLLKGNPDTDVKITVKREGVDEPLDFIIKREIIEIKFVQFNRINKDIGYIKIEQFGDNVSSDLEKAIDELVKKQKVKGLIFDLRGNPGGYLNEAIKTLDLFFDKTLLVYTEGRNSAFNQKLYSANGKILDKDFPITLLVDFGSASASEIFTGVMKDYKRATIIGTTTFGKGLVQQIFPTKDDGALFLTISQYFTPNGYQINKKGIAPDIEVKGIEFTDEEKLIISTILKNGYIRDFVKKYGNNYSQKDFELLKSLLNSKKLILKDFYLHYLIYSEIHINDVDTLYSLTYDLQLQKAVEVISEKISQ